MKFVEVTTLNGEKTLIDCENIFVISRNKEDGGCYIFFGTDDYIKIEESYDSLKAYLTRMQEE